MLPYYILEQNEENKKFFFSQNEGYFNFWNQYLIMKIKNCKDKHWIIVNRTGNEFPHREKEMISEFMAYIEFTKSIKTGKPEEMFRDFPELNELKGE